MKKLLSSVALMFGAFAICGVVNAASLDFGDILSEDGPIIPSAYTQLLNDYSNEWGYSNDVTVTCNEEGGNVAIVSPKVEDSVFDTVPFYYLFVSPYRISNIKEGSPDVDNANIIMKGLEIKDTDGSATFNLSSADLDPSQTYYGFIAPVDMYDQVGTPSKEICFKLNSNMCMLDSECDLFDSIVNPIINDNTQEAGNTEGGDGTQEAGNVDENGEMHGAACAGMDLAHVSHSVDGDKVILTWTAVDGENVDIAILNPEEGTYEKLATVKMTDEKYVYTMRWNGEQNFMLVNDCGSVKYKADAAIQKTEKIVTPATGPAENVLYIAIAAIILYGAYAIFFRKSDNN